MHAPTYKQLSVARLVEKLMAFMLLRIKEALLDPTCADSFVLKDFALLLKQSTSSTGASRSRRSEEGGDEDDDNDQVNARQSRVKVWQHAS